MSKHQVRKPSDRPGKSKQKAVRVAEQVEPDLVMILARTVLERLEEIERETGLDRCPVLAGEIRDEGQQFMNEIAGFKARLRWIAQGM